MFLGQERYEQIFCNLLSYHLKACQIRDNPFVAVAWLLYLLLPDVFHHAGPDRARDPPGDKL